MIDYRLHVLRVLASRGTVTAAAEALNYTPSAVSHQLRGLARDLGVTLVEQDGRGVRLTSSARVLLAHADELYARWEEIRGELADVGEESAGSLRLCGFSTAAAALLPRVVAHVRARHPRCTVRIIEADPEDCFELLEADQADLAVVVATASLPPSVDPRFDQRPLLDEPQDLLVAADHPFAARTAVALAEAAGEAWIDSPDCVDHHQIQRVACAAAGFAPNIAHVTKDWSAVSALVAHGLGVSLIPRLAPVHPDHPAVRVPLCGEPLPSRRILTCVRRGSREQPAIDRGLAALHAVAADREQRPDVGDGRRGSVAEQAG